MNGPASAPRRLALAVVLAALGGAACAPGPPPRPHILVLLADDLGWNDVGWHGSVIATPHLDRLAAQGTRLEAFYAQPVCSPSRAALLTGRYPMRQGLQVMVVPPWADFGLPLEERTLADALREVGYRTAVTGKWHLGHVERGYLPTQRGFEHQHGCYNGYIDYYTHRRDGGLDWHRDDRPLEQEGYATDLIAAEAVRLVEGHDPDQPLFLLVSFTAPHGPLQAPEEYVARYPGIEDSRRQRFAAMVECMDAGVGRILAALEARGMREDTLVFFCSDNGGPVGGGGADNTPLRDGKGSLYEGGVRVPALAAWPGRVPAGAVVDAPLHLVDLYPTLLRLAGASLDQPLPLDGRDLWPTLTRGRPSPHDEILLNTEPTRAALRRGDWKLLRHEGQDDAPARLELFDLRSDPAEANDLAAQHPDVVRELAARLDAWAAEAVAPLYQPGQPSGFVAPEVWGPRDG